MMYYTGNKILQPRYASHFFVWTCMWTPEIIVVILFCTLKIEFAISDMEWTKENTIQFIKFYHDKDILWDSKNLQYKNLKKMFRKKLL